MVRLTDSLDMTIAVDCNVKPQTKQTFIPYTLYVGSFFKGSDDFLADLIKNLNAIC